MSNFKSERDSQIQELLPELIKHLTKLPPSDPRFGRFLENAIGKVNSQSELAVNGHDVQRRMDGVCEKFAVSNYQLYSDLLRQWKDEIAKHPLIASSDQVDIHWVILQLILDVAYNPVESMTNRVIKNRGKLIEFPVGIDETPEASHNALIDSLLVTNVAEDPHQTWSDDLSDWSDDDSSDTLPIVAEDRKGDGDESQLPVTIKLPANFKPPEKESHYMELKGADSEKWLRENVQNSWWLAKQASCTAVNSSFCSANFAQEWNKYLDSLSLGYISDKDLSTTSEYLLMREILWMLIAPAKVTKFFRIDENNSVELNRNVSTPSCSLPIMQAFLGNLTGYLTNLVQLKHFIQSTREENTKSLSIAYQIYTGCLQEHIHKLEEFALGVEIQLMERNDSMTSLALIESLRENHLQIIDTLHKIHSQVIIPNWRDTPAYAASANLLAKLWRRLEYPLHPLENNLSISILIPCLQSFLCIFDSWWSLGRIHDYTDEFLVTEWGDERTFTDDHRGEVTKCALIRFLVDHCKESHVVLTHLASMNRTIILNEVALTRSSYEEFLDDFLKPFKLPARITEETQTESPIPTNEYYCELMELLQLEERMKSENQRKDVEVLTSREIFELFYKNSPESLNLPFLDLALRSLRTVMNPRMEVVHNRVAKIFLDEFKIANHFRNVHWVLLLESPAMFDFYTDLFVAIEADYNNLSSYQLTAKLEACLHAVHPKMESLFTVEIDQHYYKTELDTILDCLTKMRIEYNFQAAEGILDFNATPIYNRTFQFLLQIKWALWLLENLKYGENLVRVKFFKEPNVLDFSIRRMGILRYWLLSSIKNVHSYLMHQVIETETVKLEKDLRSCTSIARIQKCHENFLGVLESKCFLAEEQHDLQKVFQELLHFILIFRDYWHQLQAISDRDYRLEQKESKRILLEIKIDHLEETYRNIHRCLGERLVQETKGNIDGHHVSGLRDVFLYKQPMITDISSNAKK